MSILFCRNVKATGYVRRAKTIAATGDPTGAQARFVKWYPDEYIWGCVAPIHDNVIIV